MQRENNRTHRPGATLAETLITVACAGLILAMAMPLVAAVRGDSLVQQSLDNLRRLGAIHQAYAADWEGRQWTVTPDNLSEILDSSSYPLNYASYPEVPRVSLGFCNGKEVTTAQGWAIQQMWYPANCTLGNFRAWNTDPFHQYANGRVYDRLFWAPRDPVLRDIPQKWFDGKDTWPCGASFYFPTYAMSVAAQVDDAVFASAARGGPQQALDLPLGHRTPSLAQAKFPDQKTHMLEHYWLNPPPPDPFIAGTDVPMFYNMSAASKPATLFFDGSVRLLPVIEVLVSNDQVRRGGGERLWQEDAHCFGSGGYFESYSLELSRDSSLVEGLIDKTTSYHVFTRDGILGRDTIYSGGQE